MGLDGVHVEKGLSGVGVAAVAGVDDRAVKVPGQEIWRPRVRMAHDDDVRAHRLKGQGRVVQRLAFRHAAAAHRYVGDVGAQYLARLLEGDAGARARLVEQGDDTLASKSRDFPDVPPQDLLHDIGVLKGLLDLFPGEVVEVQDVPPPGASLSLRGACGLRLLDLA